MQLVSSHCSSKGHFADRSILAAVCCLSTALFGSVVRCRPVSLSFSVMPNTRNTNNSFSSATFSQELSYASSSLIACTVSTFLPPLSVATSTCGASADDTAFYSAFLTTVVDAVKLVLSSESFGMSSLVSANPGVVILILLSQPSPVPVVCCLLSPASDLGARATVLSASDVGFSVPTALLTP